MGQSIRKTQQKKLNTLRTSIRSINEQIYNLTQQNRYLIRQVISQARNSAQSKLQAFMYLNYKHFKCLMCLQFFNEDSKLPIMICKRQHSVCQDCFNTILIKKEDTCFICSQNLRNMGKNRKLSFIVTNKQKLLDISDNKLDKVLNEGKPFHLNSGIVQRRLIRIIKGPYKKELTITREVLVKNQKKDEWYSVKSKQAFRPYTINEVSFKIANSLSNSFVVGITSSNQQYKKTSVFKNSIAYNLSNGDILNMGSNNTLAHEWKFNGGKIVKKDTNPVVSMIVDRFKQTMTWNVDLQKYAQTKIPSRYFQKEFYAFISIFHCEDMILLNCWK